MLNLSTYVSSRASTFESHLHSNWAVVSRVDANYYIGTFYSVVRSKLLYNSGIFRGSLGHNTFGWILFDLFRIFPLCSYRVAR